jgi:AcrR family transcriptional regulator
MSSAAETTRGGDAVRAALVEAAAEMLADVGPRALSVRDIARRAGVNHGQVHHYFGSKRSLLEAAMRKLAQDHVDQMTRLSGGRPVPPALALAEDPAYWRAVCQVVMEGDLELARLEIDEGISVPRRTLRALEQRRADAGSNLAFKARFAAMMALNLGWVAFEEFVLLATDVDEGDRERVREHVKRFIESLVSEELA